MATAVAPVPAAAAPGVSGRAPRSWLEYRHRDYAAHVARWRFAMDVYTGAVVEPAVIAQYLVRRAIGETDLAYQERCRLADYTNHYAQVVESLVGMLTAVEGDANRVWNDAAGHGLGDPADPATVIGQLWRRADADGRGYLTVWKQLAIQLAITHVAWVMVDSVDGAPRYRVLSPVAVPNWTDDFREALVMEEADARTSLRDAPGAVTQYVHLTTGGWQRYRLGGDGTPIALGGDGDVGVWEYTAADGTPALPLFRVELPMQRPVGYQLARKAVAIFNLESARDHLLRVANFPRLVLAAADTLFDKLVTDLARGSNALQEDPKDSGKGHRYITPPTDAAELASTTIKAKIQDFHATAHTDYDDSAAAQRTATEIRQEVASGTGAFLQLLKAGLDDAENAALWRTEQTVFPDDRRRWHVAHVERSDNFLPADPDAVAERTAAFAFGKERTVPVGVAGLVEVAKQVATYRGVAFDEAQLEAAVTVRGIVDVLESAPLTGIQLPAEVRVDLAVQLLVAHGLLDPDAVVAMEGGQERKRLEVLREQMLRAAEAADEAKRREAETVIPPRTDPSRDDPIPPKPEA